jgi:hypothetical protein
MRFLSSGLRRRLELAVVEGRRVAEGGVRAAFASLGVAEVEKPGHLDEARARLRRGLRAKQRQLGGDFEVLVWDAAYEQWHRLLFARFLAENGLLLHPQYGAPVTVEECGEFADGLGEPDAWAVAARFASEILPGIFRLEDPCVQVRLAAEHRLALEQIVAGLPAEVFVADDSLGWVYQYWQSERKEAVNASEVKIGGADLGPVTQLFTENYMVRFLLENSLGAWWAARRPDSPLVKDFEYLRFDEDGRPAAGAFEEWPGSVAEVTVMDPCCGSGHFLVEAFGMLWRMRAEEQGLDPVAAQDAVLRDNLFGLELDPRCVQIAMFAVALTAWKQGGGWRELPTPNVACSGIPVKAPLVEWKALAQGDERLEGALTRLHTLFRDADTLGSLIDPRRATEYANAAGLQRSFDDVDFDEVAPLLEKAAARETSDPATAVLGADAAGIARAATLLARRYTLITTNVPYLLNNKQGVTLAQYSREHMIEASRDLALTFLVRSREMTSTGGSYAVVTPQSWLTLGTYRPLREVILTNQQLNVIARLGSRAFSAISGEVVNVLLGVFTNQLPSGESTMAGLDLAACQTPSDKASALTRQAMKFPKQAEHLSRPFARIVTSTDVAPGLLGDVVDTYQGICLGDSSRFRQHFWEGLKSLKWNLQQNSVARDRLYGGREYRMQWDGGHGQFMSYVVERLGVNGTGAWIRGLEAWGRFGVAISNTGEMRSTIYTGEPFQHNLAILIPKDPDDLAVIWTFVCSEEFKSSVREIDTALKVENTVFRQVPFDVERWRGVAEVDFPDGLPERWSDDPTQWLFEGRPEVATEPLQVGVGRLVGYRWPEQAESDDLSSLADADGIVCLPAVRGELPAADRLQQLLAQAYGEKRAPGLVRELLEKAGSKKKSLAEWLRDDFFAHHCKVFGNRPFVWHVWDGRRDGFAALVNYHRLDRAGLEKLTYTYLGDWIERQRADAGEGVAGADTRLAAAVELRAKLVAILEGEPPYDIYVRWKELREQPIGWEPDLDDGVRLNIRPFVTAGVLRSRVNVHWKKDRGKNPDGSERINDLNYTRAEKQQARHKAGTDE